MKTTNAQTPKLQDNFVQFFIKDRLYHARRVKGYYGYYATTCGHIISLVSSNRTRLRKLDWSSPQLLTGKDNGHGYLQVKLYSDDGHGKWHLVHRLVALTHLEKPKSHMSIGDLQVNHYNKNRQDNHARNLAWTTPQENTEWNTVMDEVAKESRNAETI